MTDFATQLAAFSQIRRNIFAPTPIYRKIYPGQLASTAQANDTIQVLKLPEKARIIDASIRTSASIGESGSTIQLQALQDTTATDLTDVLDATAAGSNRMNVAPLPINADNETIVRLIVETANLTASTTGFVEVFLLVDFADVG